MNQPARAGHGMAFVALGSNLGDARAQVLRAMERLEVCRSGPCSAPRYGKPRRWIVRPARQSSSTRSSG